MTARLSFVLLSVFLLWACEASSNKTALDSIPNPRTTHQGWVSDPSNALGEARGLIEQELESLHRETQAEVAFVVVPSIGDADPKSFAVELFKHWGIGRREHDDGLLVLHVLDVRRVEIEVGYGLEGALPDAKCAWLLDDVLIPKLRENQFGAGHLALARGLSHGVRSPMATREQLLQAASGGEVGVASPPEQAHTSEPEPRKLNPDADSFLRLAEDAGPLSTLVWLFALAMYFVRSRAHRSLYRNPKRRPDSYAGFLLVVASVIAGIFFLAAWITENTWVVWVGPFAIGALAVRFVSSSLRDFREGRARHAPRTCKTCQKTMALVHDNKDDKHLSPGQRTEERLRSADYFVWRCQCGETQIERYQDEADLKTCASCGFATEQEKGRTVLVKPTTQREGKAEVHHMCAHCKAQRVEQRVLPRVEASSSASGGSSRSSSSRGGGSSFGGGRSGGGGAGRSY